MATSFEKVYRYFLMNIEDDGLPYLEKEDFYTLLNTYLTQAAVLDFKECRTSLAFNLGEQFKDKFIVYKNNKKFYLQPYNENTIYEVVVLLNGMIVDECYYTIEEKEVTDAPVLPLPDEGDYPLEKPEEPEIPEPELPEEETPPNPPTPPETGEGEGEGEVFINIEDLEELPEGELPEDDNIEVPEEDEEEREIITKLATIVEFIITPEDGDEVVIISKEIGYFKEDLTDEEVLIIVEAMKLHWLRKQILREENLKASISVSDFKKTSNANLLDKLLLLEAKTESNLKQYKINYTLEDFEGFY